MPLKHFWCDAVTLISVWFIIIIIMADTLSTKWSHVNRRSGVDQGKSASQRPTS